MNIPIVVTTSNKYHHLLRIFIYLFNKNWSSEQRVEIVGYDKPNFYLPLNFSFHSMGEQVGGPNNFTTDLRKYFEKQEQWLIWLFEDSFIKDVDFKRLQYVSDLREVNVGRINLAREAIKQDHFLIGSSEYGNLYENTQTANYRLSTQPSIWNKDFLLRYMIPGLTPWQFETQDSVNDGWRILGLGDAVVSHNEGVTKRDIYDYDLNGIDEEQIREMIELRML